MGMRHSQLLGSFLATALLATVAGTVWWKLGPAEGVASAAESARLDATGHDDVSAAQEVRSVELLGANLPSWTLRSALTTQVGTTLDQAHLDADRSMLRDMLVARGHWAVAVAAPQISFAPSGGAYVTFDIAVGEVYRVGAIRVVGVNAARAASLASTVTLAIGDDVLPERLQRNVELLSDELVRQGARHPMVTSAVQLDHNAPTATLVFTVTNG